MPLARAAHGTTEQSQHPVGRQTTNEMPTSQMTPQRKEHTSGCNNLPNVFFKACQEQTWQSALKNGTEPNKNMSSTLQKSKSGADSKKETNTRDKQRDWIRNYGLGRCLGRKKEVLPATIIVHWTHKTEKNMPPKTVGAETKGT